jgi:metal-responsive CopG/Arc/MetJ family transcriptional regulator
MKGKTSITLSKDVLGALDAAVGSTTSRSAFVERVLRQYFKRRARRQTGDRDRGQLDRHAGKLNREMADVLSYQRWPKG